MSKNSWLLEVEQAEDGEYFIQLTDEMLEKSGFAIGDELDWLDNKDGSFTLMKKKPKTVLVMVDALQTYRMRYLVEVPASNPEWALDTVTMNEAKEFSQEALPELICSHRVVTREEALAMCDVDNDYAKSWTDEKKMEVFCTPDDYKAQEDPHHHLYRNLK
jgi:hypothetical protein